MLALPDDKRCPRGLLDSLLARTLARSSSSPGFRNPSFTTSLRLRFTAFD
jgi:hypothetical protein